MQFFLFFLVDSTRQERNLRGMKLNLLFILLTSASLVIPGLVGAQPTYDGLSTGVYTDGETVDSINGGEQWDGSWSVDTSGSFNNINRYHGSNVSLGYTDNSGNMLPTTAGSLELVSAGAGAGALTRTMQAPVSGEVWMAFLNIRTDTDNWGWQIGLTDSAGNVQANVQNASSSGKFRLQAGGQTSSNLSVDNFDTSWSPGDEGQLYLLKLTNVGSGAADGTATLWVNPLDLENPEGGAQDSVTLNALELNDVEQFRFDKGVGLTGYFDELRIGSSSTEVLQIPELSNFGLFIALAAISFRVFGRNRKG